MNSTLFAVLPPKRIDAYRTGFRKVSTSWKSETETEAVYIVCNWKRNMTYKAVYTSDQSESDLVLQRGQRHGRFHFFMFIKSQEKNSWFLRPFKVNRLHWFPVTSKDVQRNILILAELFNIAVNECCAKKSGRLKWVFVTAEVATSRTQCISALKM